MPKQSPTSQTSQALIVHADEGRAYRAFGDTLAVKLAGASTAGSFMLATASTPPGGGPPEHIHHNEDEVLFVLEGKVALFIGGEWTEVAPGGLAYLPCGVPHTFRNVGDTTSRMIVLTLPAGFEEFFARAAAMFAQGTPDMAQIVETCGAFGIEFVEPKA